MSGSRKIKLCLLALLMCTVAAAAGCGEDHTHGYSQAWAFDAEAHWHPATCGHDERSEQSAHDFKETVIPPSASSAGYTLHTCVCGYSYATDPTDPLPPQTETEYRYNAEQHWSVPNGGGTAQAEAHAYREEKVQATCTSAGYTKHSCVCGYWYATDPTEPAAHTYDAGEFEHNEGAHWHICTVCGGQAERKEHTLTEKVTPATCDTDGYTEFSCKECGYSYRGQTVQKGHSFAQDLSHDEYEHWHPATCTHQSERADVQDHVLEKGSTTCLICGAQVSPRLSYQLSAGQDYYIVTGIGSITGTKVEIPATYREKPVKEIGAKAFADSGITEVTFGENLEKIGTGAFLDTAISSLALPEKLTEVGAKAFAGTAITRVTLGESVQTVGQGAFRGCLSLAEAELHCKTIPDFAFEGCAVLKTVNGQTVTAVGAQAFAGTALQTIDLSKCERVGFAAFEGCASFAPASLAALTYAEEYAFSGCGAVHAALPALKAIPDLLFFGCASLQDATLSAETIGQSAFADCTKLSTVTLSGTKQIGQSAFAGCTQLSAPQLPDTLVRVGGDAFRDATFITEEGGARYAANVLLGATAGTQNIRVKAGTVGIADGAFEDRTEAGNTTLKTVELADSVRFIGTNAFRGCTGLTAISFGKVKYIWANAFRGSGLQQVNVPASVEIVGDNAFYDCKQLASAEVHAKEIGKFAFSYTGVDRSLSSPVKQRPDYAKLTAVTLGSEVDTIGSNAFQYCPIGNIALPAGLVSIGNYAFAQTDLASVEIPASVTRIGEYAFYGCTKLTSATFRDTQNWKAGKAAVVFGTAAENAKLLTEKYLDVDWIRG